MAVNENFRHELLFSIINDIKQLMLSLKKHTNNFDDFLQAKAYIGKYLKEKWLSEHRQQLSLKYFVKSFTFPKLLSNVS